MNAIKRDFLGRVTTCWSSEGILCRYLVPLSDDVTKVVPSTCITPLCEDISHTIHRKPTTTPHQFAWGRVQRRGVHHKRSTRSSLFIFWVGRGGGDYLDFTWVKARISPAFSLMLCLHHRQFMCGDKKELNNINRTASKVILYYASAIHLYPKTFFKINELRNRSHMK